MRFLDLALVSLVVGAPLEKKNDDTSTFRIPNIGDDITEWTNKLIGHVADLIWDHIPMNIVDAVVPHMSLDLNAKLVQPLAFGIPNFNTDFEDQKGLDTSRVRWLFEADNRTPEDPVIFYVHGGGYGWSALPTHSLWPVEMYKKLNNDRLSVLWLDYSLSSEHQWPMPLQQSVEVYNTLRNSCKNIILAGDSSGGHNIIQFSRHYKYPYPGIDTLDSLPEAMVLLSPAPVWNLNDNEGSAKKYKGVDWLDASSIVGWAELETKNDTSLISSFAFDIRNDTIDWSDNDILPDPHKIFVGYGEHEVLKDGVEVWLNKTQIEDRGATIFVKPQGTHDSLIVGGVLDAIFEPLHQFFSDVL